MGSVIRTSNWPWHWLPHSLPSVWLRERHLGDGFLILCPAFGCESATWEICSVFGWGQLPAMGLIGICWWSFNWSCLAEVSCQEGILRISGVLEENRSGMNMSLWFIRVHVQSMHVWRHAVLPEFCCSQPYPPRIRFRWRTSNWPWHWLPHSLPSVWLRERHLGDGFLILCPAFGCESATWEICSVFGWGQLPAMGLIGICWWSFNWSCLAEVSCQEGILRISGVLEENRSGMNIAMLNYQRVPWKVLRK